jgi:hypothetical protein
MDTASYIDAIIKLWPVLALLAGLWLRLELKIAEVKRDLWWIKRELNKCQQTLDPPTRSPGEANPNTC